MNNSIKCNECGGNKCQNISGNTYRCLYCGSTFIDQTSVPPIPAPQLEPKIVYINQPAPVFPHYYQPMREHKSKATALLLTFFLGWLGIEWFYLGNTAMGILSLLFFWTGIPAMIAFIHFIVILCTSTESFNRQYY